MTDESSPTGAEESPAEMTAEFHPTPFAMQFAAVSDIGRMRKDNQDSGYAGPWLLAVCDGVGGAARGDLASATAIDELRLLDKRPPGDPLQEVRASLGRVHDRIGRLVRAEPVLNGTSTTAVIALFDGHQLTFGHVGDSRAYLVRAGAISQLTRDHTFVQSLIDEGRLSEEAARNHPNRNLILKALDGVHEADPDIFGLDLVAGDRILVCSDGASGVLDDDDLLGLLSEGDAQQAAAAIVRASLDAGSTDNVTCVIGDIIAIDEATPQTAVAVGAVAADPIEPGQLRHAAQWVAGQRGSSPRSSATSNVPEATTAGPSGTSTDLDVRGALDGDPEASRYAPRPPRRFGKVRRLLATIVLLGLAWIAGTAAWSWSQNQYYIGAQDGQVTIFRGVNADLKLLTLSQPFETTDVAIARLAKVDADRVTNGITAGSLAEARRTVDGLANQQVEPATP